MMRRFLERHWVPLFVAWLIGLVVASIVKGMMDTPVDPSPELPPGITRFHDDTYGATCWTAGASIYCLPDSQLKGTSHER